LNFAEVAAKYELGHYDSEELQGVSVDVSGVDEFVKEWIDHPILEQLNIAPWYGFELPYVMSTSVLGCQIELNIRNAVTNGEIEVGSTILATIESFLVTGIMHNLISSAGKITIEIKYSESISSITEMEIDEMQSNRILVYFKKCSKDNFVQDQEKFSDFLIELIGKVVAIMFPHDIEKLKKMTLLDFAFPRSQTFANSVFYGLETFGTEIFSFEHVINDHEKLPVLRTSKSPITRVLLNKNDEDEIQKNKLKIQYEKPTEESVLSNVGHADIKTLSTINSALWDKSEWLAILFETVEPPNACPPFFSLVFSNEASKTIFNEWISDIGKYDEKDEIEIRIIKGIDQKNPYCYRVVISPSNNMEKHFDEFKQIMFPARIHTMNAKSSINLKRFESALIANEYFYICHAMINHSTEVPVTDKSLKIKKNKSSIKIINAWEISEDDFVAYYGILPDDRPVLPKGFTKAPILEMIKRKQLIREA
jgi:hypothetical protein